MHNYTHIIWDWNGTLLDDLAWCISVINAMLRKRNMPVIESIEEYHEVFCFPVIDYYRNLGFDFTVEPFKKIAVEYIDLYYGPMNKAELFPDAVRILSECQNKGIKQIILSASESNKLLEQVKPFCIGSFFDEILGITNIYATSKVDLGKAYIKRAKPEKALLIGDTEHDKQVAGALGVDCILVAGGHQSKRTLLSCGAAVVDRLPDVCGIIGI